jgi:hypothetical protein
LKRAKFYLLFLFTTFVICTNAQIFDLPIKNEIGIAGNFCELRGSHFHTGLDFRTNGVENLPIYTAAEGYVSRIVISSTGYGKALYISHPKLGLTTLYAHFNSFSPKIDFLISSIQNKLQVNTIDTTFPTPNIWIKRGEQIGLSGNTGNSFAPHLHFEIRNTATEVVYNPEPYFKQIADKIPPLLPKLYLFDLENHTPKFIREIDVNEKGKNLAIDVESLGIGISAKDYYTDKNNVMGIYSAKLYEGFNPLFQIQFDSISFSNTSQVKTVSEYNYPQIKDCYKLFNEKCSNNMFENPSNGYLLFNPNETKKVKIEISDYQGNQNYIHLLIRYIPKPSAMQIDKDPNLININCDNENIIQSQFYKIELPPNTFPFDQDWRHSLKMKMDSTPFLNLFEENTPCMKPFSISFNRNNFCLQCDWEKYIAVLNAMTHKKTIPLFWTDSTFIVKGLKSFGTIEFIKDTTLPSISTPVIKNNRIECKIKDLESGIKTYNGYINSKWHRLYYDEKNDIIFFDGLKNDNPKKNNILLEIEDKVGNKKTLETELFF